MADNKTDPFAPPTTGGDFSRAFPTYEKCDVIGAGAAVFNRSMLTSVGIDKPQFKDGSVGKAGNKRLNIQQYRCLLLTQKMQEVGLRRVLDVPNYLDCRVDPPPNINATINDAIKEYGASNSYTPDTLTRILRDIDDQMESGASRDALGPLANVISQLADFPQQGTPARVLLESSLETLYTSLDALVNILKDSFKAAGATIENVKIIVLSFVDMIFFIGDYVTEQKNLRKELAARLLSMQRSVGFGDKQGVAGAYKITYGNGPSMQTIRAWCTAGVKANPQDLFLWPDGTTSAYMDAHAQWEATRQVVTDALPPLLKTFNYDYAEFFGACFFLAAFRRVYSVGEFKYYIGGQYNLDSVMRAAVQNGNASQVVENLGTGPSRIYLPSLEEQQAITRVEAGNCSDTDYWVPFWEDTSWGNYHNDPSGERADTRILYRNRLRDYIFTKWTTASAPQACAWPHGRERYVTYTGRRIDEFARKITVAYDFLWQWALIAYPSYGSIRLGREIEKKLYDNVDKFFDLAMGRTSLEGMDWVKAILLVLLPSGEINKFGSINKIALGPEPKKSSYMGTKARCPGGTNDKSCLPCDTIKGRRPVGAKPIEIPTVLKWSGNAGPLSSPEYQTWSANLRTAGYPDYYIDCLTQELVFEALPGASTAQMPDSQKILWGAFSKQPLQNLTSNVPMQTLKLSGLLPGPPVTGLRAPYVASLGAMPAKGPTAVDRKRQGTRAGLLTIRQKRARGLLPVGKSGQLHGLESAGSSSSSVTGWVVGGLVVAGLVYAANRSSKRSSKK